MTTGSVVIVTGAAGGIGTATVTRLLDSGYRVAAVDVSRPALDALVASLEAGEALRPYETDVTDSAAVTELFTAVERELGPLYGVVNLAGTNLVRPIEEVTDEEWDRIITLNLTTTFYCCRAAARTLRPHGRGRIVNMGSIFGIRGELDEVPYSAAKSGIIGLTRALATELAADQVTVNALAPVATLTPRVASFDPEFLDHQLAQIPMGRFGTPEDVAATINFLLSEDASFFTGQVFSPNGGDTMA